MQFVILAYDAKDEGAQARRMECRAAHTQGITKARATGNIFCGVALLDESGKMIGSNIMVNFPTRAELDSWLADEPYITGKVWEKVSVIPAKLGDSFKDLITTCHSE
jgi:uncharacterized protein YciI